MKKIFYGLIISSFLIFAGCGDDNKNNTATNPVNPEVPTIETTLTIEDVNKTYDLIIANTTNNFSHSNYVFFNIINHTANDYNNIQIKPVITDENNNILTEADGFTYSSILLSPNNDASCKVNEKCYANIDIVYTGAPKQNLNFSVEISSDNMPTENYNFNTVSFNTYVQAFLYNESDSTSTLIPIVADTNVTSSAGEPIRIIFKNSMPLDNAPILMESGIKGSGTIQLLQDNMTLSDGTIYEPCAKGSLAINHTLVIGKNVPYCYLDIIQNESDEWSYNIVKNGGYIDVASKGYKITDNISIVVK